MMRSVGEDSIEVAGKIAVVSWKVDSFFKLNKALSTAAILYDLSDRACLETVLFLILSKVTNPSHGAIFVHYLAEHSSGRQACNPRKIDSSLSMPGPAENATIFCLKWKDMTGLDTVSYTHLTLPTKA